MSSSSLYTLLLLWVSSSVANRAVPLAVTWYSPESARSQRSDPLAGSNSDEISVMGSNPDSPLMDKSTSILYGDQLPLTSLRLDKMEEDWLHNTLEPEMEETPSDTDISPSSEQHEQFQEARNVNAFYPLDEQRSKKRGDGHSLSVVNPVDVIRQSMLMGAARERMRQNQNQIEANAQLLNQIGKRQTWHRQPRWLQAWDASKVALETSRTQAS